MNPTSKMILFKKRECVFEVHSTDAHARSLAPLARCTLLMAAMPTEPAETGAGGTTQPAGAADDVLLPGQPGLGGAGGPGAQEPGAVLTDGRAAPAPPQREEALPPAPAPAALSAPTAAPAPRAEIRLRDDAGELKEYDGNGDELGPLPASKLCDVAALAREVERQRQPAEAARRAALRGGEDRAWEMGEPHGLGPDLRGLDLQDRDMTALDLEGADLRGANLAGATMHYCDARGANMEGAVVSEGFEAPDPGDDRWRKWDLGETGKKPSRVVSLRGARLVDATLPENMQGVDLVRADMGGIVLCERHMEGADFR